MGVIGITPFLLKAFPQVVKSLPERARELAGKTVVFDGTLITQRFHFANNPHPHRHVIGWYKVIKELNDAGVRAICVFDGQRNAAKEAEVQRRRDVRKLDSARGAVESERLSRLQVLHRLLRQAETLADGERERLIAPLAHSVDVSNLLGLSNDVGDVAIPQPPSGAGAAAPLLPPRSRSEEINWNTYRTVEQDIVDDMLKRASTQSLLGLASKRPSAKGDLQSESVPVGSTSSTTTAAELIKPTSAKIEQLLKPVAATEPTKPLSVSEESTPSTVAAPKPIESTSLGQSPTPIEAASTVEGHIEESEPVSPLEVLAHALTKLELAPSQTTPPSAPTEPVNPELEKNMAASDLTFGLTQLFARFQRSVPEVEESAAEASSTPAADADDAQTLRTVSKQQRALTAGEARVWRALPSARDCGALAADVAGLLGQSVLIAESYGRRANVATAQTYAEAREVLGALGVPCILPAGACEAEALAAALVVHGHADYVVSEDTDVLVYEAPLVRNMTNRLGPLQVISGAEVRGALGLDRAGFVDFALLLGTDFSQRIKNVGPARALKLIRTHGSIEGIVRAEGRYPPRVPVDAYLAQVAVARAVFGTLPPVPDVEELASQPADDARARDVLRKYGVRDADFTSWEADEGAGAMGDAYFGDHPSSIREQDFDSFVPYQ